MKLMSSLYIGNMWKKGMINGNMCCCIFLSSQEAKYQMNNHSLIGIINLDFIELGLHYKKIIPKVDVLQNSLCVFFHYKINAYSSYNIYDILKNKND
jgi:hypothetical protein